MIERRQFILAVTSLVFLQNNAIAKNILKNNIGWHEFINLMNELAKTAAAGNMDFSTTARYGTQYLEQLTIDSSEFRQAVESSYESGNQFWLWQRLIKQQNLNGGILNVSSDKIVQLHDHPHAVGMLRIISGELEVWQYDEIKPITNSSETTRLVRTSHKILRPGDTAILTPKKGNIHALRAISNECRMLDCFIPPYKRSERSWFEPLEQNWFDKKTLTCRKIPQHEFRMS